MKKLQYWIDKIAVSISAILLAIMMAILVVNIILRYAPGVSGFSWYMESSQYINVWAMFVAGIAICVRNEHLNVQVLESSVRGVGKKIVKTIIALFTTLFYIILAYSTYLLASNSRQEISTMPIFKMSLVYWVLPIICILSAASILIALYIDLTNKKDEEVENEGGTA